MPQAMKILDGKKLKPISAWDLRKVKSKKDVIMEAQRDNMRVHFATLMDMCHIKKCGVGTQIAQEQRQSRALGGHCKGRLWSLSSLH